ncbi:pirin family protein [Sulfitobacter sp. F26169L]|uniref:pirin family protein n=1 Tax=Sulfitobacter sp. F26169L TaxID=2996015 RepID=UPI002260A792|nr:pirin-like bicupin family protein [Sulfitobacter sp. F26169L]MCX7565000.1 pirin family protein [Sulfitobacter sp. F26169L]
MITIHQKAVRGHTRGGWLDSYHTFSFGSFQDPKRMGFGNLRVLNEDTIIPGSGFASHPHADMDILTYVIKGQLRHEDDQGNVSLINAGEAQLMSAGSGVTHSERNASDTETAHLFQIWLIPDTTGGKPTYAQRAVPQAGNVLIAGPETSQPLLTLNSATTVELIRVKDGDRTPVADPDTLRFLHIIDGLAFAEGEHLSAGDGLQVPAGEETTLDWASDGAALIFTMPREKK